MSTSPGRRPTAISLIDPFVSATTMLQALRTRQVSAVELFDLHVHRIERYNPALNAMAIDDFERARRVAADADDRRARGEDAPMLGLPVTFKDWIEVEGVRSTAGDANLAKSNYCARSDGPVVARIRAAGAVIMGKTNMAPWGGDWQTINPVFGRSNNPWDLERTPGGSTGGGAAAVAAGLSPLEFGNDIGGSVRVPPAFCGIYGHRPSETALPRTGQTPDPSGRHLPNPVTGQGVMGPLARCADDLALAFDTACGPDQGEDVAWRLQVPPPRHDRLRDFRVAVMPRLAWLPVDNEIMAAQERVVAALGAAGAAVNEIAPEGFGDLLEHHKLYHKLLTSAMTMALPHDLRREMAAWGHAEAKVRGDEFMEAGAQAIEASAADYVGWYGQREVYRAAYRAFFHDWDILLAPVTLVSAFRHSAAPPEVEGDDRVLCINGVDVPYMRLSVYPGLATLCGQPATAFPAGFTTSGLPVGLQAIGPYLEDHTPIRFAGLVAEVCGGFVAPPGDREV